MPLDLDYLLQSRRKRAGVSASRTRTPVDPYAEAEEEAYQAELKRQKEMAGLAEENAKLAAKAEQEAAKAEQRARNNAFEATTRRSGQPTYVDADGNIQSPFTAEEWAAKQAQEQAEDQRRVKAFQSGRPFIKDLEGNTVYQHTDAEWEQLQAEKKAKQAADLLDKQTKAWREQKGQALGAAEDQAGAVMRQLDLEGQSLNVKHKTLADTVRKAEDQIKRLKIEIEDGATEDGTILDGAAISKREEALKKLVGERDRVAAQADEAESTLRAHELRKLEYSKADNAVRGWIEKERNGLKTAEMPVQMGVKNAESRNQKPEAGKSARAPVEEPATGATDPEVLRKALIEGRVAALAENPDLDEAERRYRTASLMLRRDNPAAFEARQMQEFEARDPQSLRAALDEHAADFEARKADWQMRRDALAQEATAVQGEIEAILARNAQRLQQPHAAADLVTYRKEDGSSVSVFKDLATLYDQAQEKAQAFQKQRQPEIDSQQAEAQEIERDARLLNQGAAILKRKGVEVEAQAQEERTQVYDRLNAIPGAKLGDELAAVDAAVRKHAGGDDAGLQEWAQKEREKITAKAKAIPEAGQDLYAKWGSGLNYDWANVTPDDSIYGRMVDEGKKRGLDEAGTKHWLTSMAQADWTKPNVIGGKEIDPATQDVRFLPSGDITVNPAHLLDKEAYEQVVKDSNATPEAQQKALEVRQAIAPALAAQAIKALRQNSSMSDWLDSHTSGTDLERMEQFTREMKADGWTNAALMRFMAAAASIGKSWTGAAGAVTGSDTFTQASVPSILSADYWNKRAEAYSTAAGTAEKGTNILGKYAAMVAGGIPSVLESVAAGGVVGNVVKGGAAMRGAYQIAKAGKTIQGAKNAAEAAEIAAKAGGLTPKMLQTAGVTGAAIDAGIQQAGGTYFDAYKHYLEDELAQITFASDGEFGGPSKEEVEEARMRARSKALTPAILDAVQTAALTALGGAKGAEAVFRSGADASIKKAFKTGVGKVLAQIGVDAGEEALEEYANQFVSGVIAQATYQPELTTQQLFAEALDAGLVGGILGGGMGTFRAVGEYRADKQAMNRPAPAVTPDGQDLSSQEPAKVVTGNEDGPEWISRRGLERAAQNRLEELRTKQSGTDEVDVPGLGKVPATIGQVLSFGEKQELEFLEKALADENNIDHAAVAKRYGKKIKSTKEAAASSPTAAPAVEAKISWQKPKPLEMQERRSLEQRAEDAVAGDEEQMKRLARLRQSHKELRRELEDATTDGDKRRITEEILDLENSLRKLAGEPEIQVTAPVTPEDQAKSKAWFARRAQEIEAKLSNNEPITPQDRQDWKIAGRDESLLPPKEHDVKTPSPAAALVGPALSPEPEAAPESELSKPDMSNGAVEGGISEAGRSARAPVEETAKPTPQDAQAEIAAFGDPGLKPHQVEATKQKAAVLLRIAQGETLGDFTDEELRSVGLNRDGSAGHYETVPVDKKDPAKGSTSVWKDGPRADGFQPVLVENGELIITQRQIDNLKKRLPAVAAQIGLGEVERRKQIAEKGKKIQPSPAPAQAFDPAVEQRVDEIATELASRGLTGAEALQAARGVVESMGITGDRYEMQMIEPAFEDAMKAQGWQRDPAKLSKWIRKGQFAPKPKAIAEKQPSTTVNQVQPRSSAPAPLIERSDWKQAQGEVIGKLQALAKNALDKKAAADRIKSVVKRFNKLEELIDTKFGRLFEGVRLVPNGTYAEGGGLLANPTGYDAQGRATGVELIIDPLAFAENGSVTDAEIERALDEEWQHRADLMVMSRDEAIVLAQAIHAARPGVFTAAWKQYFAVPIKDGTMPPAPPKELSDEEAYMLYFEASRMIRQGRFTSENAAIRDVSLLQRMYLYLSRWINFVKREMRRLPQDLRDAWQGRLNAAEAVLEKTRKAGIAAQKAELDEVEPPSRKATEVKTTDSVEDELAAAADEEMAEAKRERRGVVRNPFENALRAMRQIPDPDTGKENIIVWLARHHGRITRPSKDWLAKKAREGNDRRKIGDWDDIEQASLPPFYQQMLFKRGNGSTIDRALQALHEAGFFPGVAEGDVTGAMLAAKVQDVIARYQALKQGGPVTESDEEAAHFAKLEAQRLEFERSTASGPIPVAAHQLREGDVMMVKGDDGKLHRVEVLRLDTEPVPAGEDYDPDANPAQFMGPDGPMQIVSVTLKDGTTFGVQQIDGQEGMDVDAMIEREAFDFYAGLSDAVHNRTIDDADAVLRVMQQEGMDAQTPFSQIVLAVQQKLRVPMRRAQKMLGQVFNADTNPTVWTNEELKQALESPLGSPRKQGIPDWQRQHIETERETVRTKYQNTDKWMKAPNGKPSRLTTDQWITVRTPSFKRWFGDWESFANGKDGNGVWQDDSEQVSKVVDENGEPRVVYHGTKGSGFHTFDPSKGNNGRRPDSVFFSSHRAVSRTYSGSRDAADVTEDEDGYYDEKRGIYSVFLNLRRPHEENFEGANWDGTRHGQYQVVNGDDLDVENVYDKETGRGIFDDESEAEAVAAKNPGSRVEEAPDHYASTNSVAADASRYGADGAIIQDVTDDGGQGDSFERGTVYVAFRANQIKSAVANSGMFDDQTGNILFSPRKQSAPGLFGEDEMNFLGDRNTLGLFEQKRPIQPAQSFTFEATTPEQIEAERARKELREKKPASPKDFALGLPSSETGELPPQKDATKPRGLAANATPFIEGQITADHWGDDPFVYRDQWVNPREFKDAFNLEGLTYEQVVNMPSTQQYIQWYREGHTPPPITLVFNEPEKRLRSINRRRLVAALETGQTRIPARVDIGRASQFMKRQSDGVLGNPQDSTTPATPVSPSSDFSLEATTPEQIEAEQARKELREKLRARQDKPLIGTQGDIGQGQLFGGGDLFAPPPAVETVGKRTTTLSAPQKRVVKALLPRLSTLHNLSEENLAFAAKMGGLAVPSMAVLPEGMGISGFGHVTLIGTKDMADPARNPVFDADAYTVRFPEPEYKKARVADTEKVTKLLRPYAQRFNDSITQHVWDNAVNRPKPEDSVKRMLNSPAAMAAFFDTQGVTVEPVMIDKPLEVPWLLQPSMKPYLEPGKISRISGTDDEELAKLTQAIETALAAYADEHYADLEPDIQQYLRVSERKEWLDDKGVHFGKLQRLEKAVAGLGTQIQDVPETKMRLDEALAGREAAFQNWVERLILPLYAPPQITLKGRKVPYTLENIVQAMSSPRVKGREDTMTFGEGAARAAVSTRFKDLEKMRAAAAEQIVPEEQVKETREAAQKLLGDYREQVAGYTTRTNYRGDPDIWEAMDASMRALTRWAKSGRTPAALKAALRAESFANVPEEVIEIGQKAAEAWLLAPVPYFEAKPQRAVALGEFAGAVIPETASAQTKAILERVGVPFRTYDGEAAQAIIAAQYARELHEQGRNTLFSPRKQSAASAPFYSKLARVIAEKMPNRADVATIKGLITNPQTGIKAEELKWSGIVPWLEGQSQTGRQGDGETGRLSKQAVLDYLDTEGKVTIEEVRMGSHRQPGYTAIRWTEVPDEMRRRVMGKDEALDSDWLILKDGEPVLLQDGSSAADALNRFDADAEEAGIPGTRETKFSQYQLPGGENYREVVLAMPEGERGFYTKQPRVDTTGWTLEMVKRRSETMRDLIVRDATGKERGLLRKWNHSDQQAIDQVAQPKDVWTQTFPEASYESSHFPDVPNYVAHMRLNDRTDAEGRTGTFIEEIQSDRHQAGREKGYRGDRFGILDKSRVVEYVDGREAAEKRADYLNRASEAVGDENRFTVVDPQMAVPDAPFRTTWPLQLFKRALAEAVATGKQWIGWTTGTTQAERYDLSKQVDRLEYWPEPQMLTAYKDGLEVIRKSGVTKDQLPDYIGKEAARKLLETPMRGSAHQLYENDLKVGGEGMKGFYDTILPKEIGKYVKAWGAGVEKGSVNIRSSESGRVWEISNETGSRYAIRRIASGDIYRDESGRAPYFDDRNQATLKAGELNRAAREIKNTPIWRVDITPQMRAGVESGQALFSPRKQSAAKAAEPAATESRAPSVDAAAHAAATSPTNDLPEPSPAQKAAGNYQKGHVTIAGHDISIENPAGSKRRPEWPVLQDHYGYFKGTNAKDGDHVDVFVKPGTPADYSGPVHVVRQNQVPADWKAKVPRSSFFVPGSQPSTKNKAPRTPPQGVFDEYKVMLGYATAEEARAAYLRNYEPGWPGLAKLTTHTLPEFQVIKDAVFTVKPKDVPGVRETDKTLRQGEEETRRQKPPVTQVLASPRKQGQSAGMASDSGAAQANTEPSPGGLTEAEVEVPRVFRGQRSPFNQAVIPKGGVHFSSDEEYARGYMLEGFSNVPTEGSSLTIASLHFKKPLDLRGVKTKQQVEQAFRKAGIPLSEKVELYPFTQNPAYQGTRTFQQWFDFLDNVPDGFGEDFSPNEAITDHIGEAVSPYVDGIIFDEHGNPDVTSYVVLKPEVIKPSFDPSRAAGGTLLSSPRKQSAPLEALARADFGHIDRAITKRLARAIAPAAEWVKKKGENGMDAALEALAGWSVAGQMEAANLADNSAEMKALRAAHRAELAAEKKKGITEAEKEKLLTRHAAERARIRQGTISPRQQKELTNQTRAQARRFWTQAKREFVPDAAIPADVLAKRREMQMNQALTNELALDVGKRSLQGKSKLSDLVVPEEQQNPEVRRRMFLAMNPKIDSGVTMDSLKPEEKRVAEALLKLRDDLGRRMVKAGRIGIQTFEAMREGTSHYYEHDVKAERSLLRQMSLGLRNLFAQTSTAFHIVDNANKQPDGSPALVMHEGHRGRPTYRFATQEQMRGFYEEFIKDQILAAGKPENVRRYPWLTPADQAALAGVTRDKLNNPGKLSKDQRAVVERLQEQLRQRFEKRVPLSFDEHEKAGLIMDPFYSISRQLAEMGHDVATAEFFNHIAGVKEYVSDTPLVGYTQMPDTAKLGRLAGKYVRDDVAAEVRQITELPGPVMRLYDGLMSLWKTGHTVLNPGSHTRNLVGNIAFAHLSGTNPLNPGNAKYYIDAIKALRDGGAEYREMYENGVLGGDFLTAEIKRSLRQLVPDAASVLREAENGSMTWLYGLKEFMARRAQGALKLPGAVAEAAAKAWQFEDDLYKAAAYLKAREMGLDPKAAAAHVQEWFPYYNKGSSNVLKGLGRFAFPFLSFKRESLRILKNGLTKKPLATLTTLLIPRLLTQVALTLGEMKLLMWTLGLGLKDERDQEDVLKALRGRAGRLLAPIAGDTSLFSILLPMRDGNGGLQQFDLSNTHPFADWLGTRIEDGDSQELGITRVARELVSGSPLLGLLLETAFNKDSFTGRRLYEDDMSTGEKLGKLAEHTYTEMMPPITPTIPVGDLKFEGTSARTIRKAFEQSPSKLMPQRNPAQAITRALGGLDIRPADPNLYEDVAQYREKNKLPAVPRGQQFPSDAAGRARAELYRLLIQPQPDVEAVKRQLDILDKHGAKIPTVQDLFEDRQPQDVMKLKGHQTRWINQLAPEAKRVLDAAKAQQQAAKPKAIDALARARRERALK